MRLRLRYVISRRNARGDVRWYWSRPGHARRRLPDSEPERLAMAARLNEMADGGRAIDQPVHGTFAWAVGVYRGSAAWGRLAAKTRAAYEPWLRFLGGKVGHRTLANLSPGDVDDMLSRVASAGRKTHLLAVLKAIVKIGIRHRCLTQDVTLGAEVPRSRVREALWSDDDLAAMKAACDAREPYGATVWLACTLMLYTGQRVGDVLSLTWGQYDGSALSLAQQKTDATLVIPCHRDLRAALDEARGVAKGTVIVARPNGLGMSWPTWNRHFNACRVVAGLQHLQARDFRRTAATRLGEIPGLSDADIASITGHAPGSPTLRQVYRKRTARQAARVVRMWEDEG